jgi:CDP-4-dehydro-6-deoxyglucose reductase
MRRPYSFASAPGAREHGRFDIAVTRVEGGPTSTALHALPLGAELHAEGPRGGWLSLRPEEQDTPTLLVATGSGLAPFRAVLEDQMGSARRAPVGLLFGCRTEADVLWADELDAWQRRLPSLRVWVTLSQPSAAWSGRDGHVQRHLAEAVRALRPELALLCGLSPMVDDVERLLTEIGVSESAIRTEPYDR